MKSKNIKKIISGIIQTILAIALIFTVLMLWGQYMTEHPGYDTPEETIMQYMQDWNKQRLSAIRSCLDPDSENYDRIITSAQKAFTDKNASVISNDNIIMKNMSVTNSVSENTTYVSIPVIQKIDDVKYNIRCDYNFKMKTYNGKWVINDINAISIVNLGIITNNNQINDKTISFNNINMDVPGNWDVSYESNLTTAYCYETNQMISISKVDYASNFDEIYRIIDTIYNGEESTANISVAEKETLFVTSEVNKENKISKSTYFIKDNDNIYEIILLSKTDEITCFAYSYIETLRFTKGD